MNLCNYGFQLLYGLNVLIRSLWPTVNCCLEEKASHACTHTQCTEWKNKYPSMRCLLKQWDWMPKNLTILTMALRVGWTLWSLYKLVEQRAHISEQEREWERRHAFMRWSKDVQPKIKVIFHICCRWCGLLCHLLSFFFIFVCCSHSFSPAKIILSFVCRAH